MNRTKRWNPKYLSGCVRHALELLPRSGAAIDLFSKAAEHVECTEKYDLRFYRGQLKQGTSRLRRLRGIEPWEYWLLSAAEQLLHPIPGSKHVAVTLLRSAVDEYDHESGGGWHEWHQQHAEKEPAYL
jgi:hypothetical protein